MTFKHISRRGLTRLLGAAGGLLVSAQVSAASNMDEPGAAMRKAEGARLSADDRLEIIELMARYAWAYDTEDAQALASTFTADGSLEVFGKLLVKHPSEFQAFLAQAKEMKGEHGWQHLADHHLFRDYDGQTCTAYSYYLMPEGDRQGGNVTLRAMGYYTSNCVRTAGGWRFSKRSVVRWNGKAPIAI